MMDALKSGILKKVKKIKWDPYGPWIYDVEAMPKYAQQLNDGIAQELLNRNGGASSSSGAWVGTGSNWEYEEGQDKKK